MIKFACETRARALCVVRGSAFKRYKPIDTGETKIFIAVLQCFLQRDSSRDHHDHDQHPNQPVPTRACTRSRQTNGDYTKQRHSKNARIQASSLGRRRQQPSCRSRDDHRRHQHHHDVVHYANECEATHHRRRAHEHKNANSPIATVASVAITAFRSVTLAFAHATK
jgi:hypothetical protein